MQTCRSHRELAMPRHMKALARAAALLRDASSRANVVISGVGGSIAIIAQSAPRRCSITTMGAPLGRSHDDAHAAGPDHRLDPVLAAHDVARARERIPDIPRVAGRLIHPASAYQPTAWRTAAGLPIVRTRDGSSSLERGRRSKAGAARGAGGGGCDEHPRPPLVCIPSSAPPERPVDELRCRRRRLAGDSHPAR